MISDFIKFVFRVIILNPMALIGIAVGVYIMHGEGMDYVQQIMNNPRVYLPQALGALWGIAVLYALLFKHVYRPEDNKINWWASFTSSFEHLLIILFAAAATCAVLWAFDGQWSARFDRYAQNIKTQDTLPTFEQ